MHAMRRAGLGMNHLIVTAMVGFRLGAPGAFLSDQAMWKVIKSRIGELGMFDLWMPKQGAELLVWGSAQVTEPVARMNVSVRCGSIFKRLAVCGDRHWIPGPLGWKASSPAPFTDMPLTWARSFGGNGLVANPEGVGADAMALIKIGQVAPLPNVTPFGRDLLHPEDAGAPVGLLPMPRVAQVPATAGTFNDAWLARHFPAMPTNFDPGFFNLAPLDQQIAGSWLGGEAVEVEGMNAAHPRLLSTIPSLRMRCFFTRQGGAELIEQATRMDTICLFPTDGIGILIFRGEIEDVGYNGKSLGDLMVGLESVDQPKSQDHYRSVHQWRADPATRVEHLQADHELMPELGITSLEEGPLPLVAPDLPSATEVRALRRQFNAAAALGSISMASVLPSPYTPHEVADVLVDPSEQGALSPQPGGVKGSPEMTESLTKLAEDLASCPDTPFDAILGNWLMEHGLEDTPWASPGGGLVGLPASLTDDAELRQETAKCIGEFVEQLQASKRQGHAIDIGALQGSFRDTWYRSVKEAAGSSMGEGVLDMSDAQAAVCEIEKPGYGAPLQNLATLLADPVNGTSFESDAKASLKSMLTAMVNDEKSREMESWLVAPEGASNPLSEVIREAGVENRLAAVEGIVNAAKAHGIELPKDMLDAMYEKLPEAETLKMTPGHQLSLDELIAMLNADESAEVARAGSSKGSADSAPAQDETAVEAAVESPQESEQKGSHAKDASMGAPSEAPLVGTQTVASDVAQSRRDSHGTSFRPAELSPAAAKALGLAVLREKAEGLSFANKDLAGADLSGADLSGVDFSDALLEGANLAGANLSGAQCVGAVFIGARLERATCTGANFTRANLGAVLAEGSNWASANLAHAVMVQANLTGANMSQAVLDGCRAKGACLSQVDLSGSMCEKGDFSQADLTDSSLVSVSWRNTWMVEALLKDCVADHATLVDCTLLDIKGEGVRLVRARLDGAKLGGAHLPGMDACGLHARDSSWYSAHLTGALFDGANLERAHFVDANLCESSLKQCNLRDAILSGANLQSANLSEAQLCGASLQGADATAADLRRAQLFGADLDGAVMDRCDLSGAQWARTLLSLPAHV